MFELRFDEVEKLRKYIQSDKVTGLPLRLKHYIFMPLLMEYLTKTGILQT